jgi:ABC-2 type transport system permease protein
MSVLTESMTDATNVKGSTMTSAIGSTLASANAELLRLRKWPAVWVTIGAWLALTAMFGYLFNYVSYTSGSTSFANEGVSPESLLAEILPANVDHVLLQGMPMFGGALMMVLGAIAAGNGYGWGTWKTVFTQGPSRRSVVTGSLAALTTFVVLTVLATLVLCFGLSLLVAGVESQSVTWPSVGDLGVALGAGFLVMEMFALVGYLLGTLARGPALSVGLGLVWVLVVENLLRGVGTLLGPIEAFTKILPGTEAGSLVGAIVGTGGPNATPGVVDTLTGGQATILLIAYLVLAPAVIAWLATRRDVA